MTKLTKRAVEALKSKNSDYFVWDDELPGFGLRIFRSGKRSYLIQYRSGGRSRRYTIGQHGVWTAETARREARKLLGKVAEGENPAEQRHLDNNSITIKELCERYLTDADKGLILGKGRRPKKASTLRIDRGRIRRHIIPLLGNRRVKDISSVDIRRFMGEVTSGNTRADVKTRKYGRAIVRGGAGTASRAVGLLGGIFTYAIEHGIIERNPAHGIKKVADKVRDRRLSTEEYRQLGLILERKGNDPRFATPSAMISALALTGCRRGEIINLLWAELDIEHSCLRLQDSKEGVSARPLGLAAIDLFESQRNLSLGEYVFTGTLEGKPLVGFPKYWKLILADTPLSDITPHVLRHSFASIANDLGFTEATISALIGHSRGTVTSRYIHSFDAALVTAADTVAGYLDRLMKGTLRKHIDHSLDRSTRERALEELFA